MIRVAAMGAIQGKALKEQVAIMAVANLSPKEISEILGKSPNHISVILNTLKKERKHGNR